MGGLVSHLLLVLKTNQLYMLVVMNPKYYLEGSSLIPIMDNLPDDDNNNNNLVGLENYQAFTKEIRVATFTHCLLALFPLLKQVRLKSVQFPRKGVHNPRKQQQV